MVMKNTRTIIQDLGWEPTKHDKLKRMIRRAASDKQLGVSYVNDGAGGYFIDDKLLTKVWQAAGISGTRRQRGQSRRKTAAQKLAAYERELAARKARAEEEANAAAEAAWLVAEKLKLHEEYGLEAPKALKEAAKATLKAVPAKQKAAK